MSALEDIKLKMKVRSIVSIHYDVRRLVAEADELLKERDAWKADAERLEQYADHLPKCKSNHPRSHMVIEKCNCGYPEALHFHEELL